MQGWIALENGSVFFGDSFGYQDTVEGELVFNTSMTGYQEILSDPSYYGQIVTMTYPHIGNYGVNPDDMESHNIHASGLIVRELCNYPSNWSSKDSLSNFLYDKRIPIMDGVDTRALTKKIRDLGAPKALVHFNQNGDHNLEFLTRTLRNWPGIKGRDLTNKINLNYKQDKKSNLNRRHALAKIIVFDFGTKANIINCLERDKVEIELVSGQTTFEEIVAMNPDGILLSNGPGDPAAVSYAIETVKTLLGKKPIFGICLGHQILALSLNAKTFKLKFGHRGINHPVKNIDSNLIEITSQNHGFAVDSNSLPPNVIETHINLNYTDTSFIFIYLFGSLVRCVKVFGPEKVCTG